MYSIKNLHLPITIIKGGFKISLLFAVYVSLQ